MAASVNRNRCRGGAGSKFNVRFSARF